MKIKKLLIVSILSLPLMLYAREGIRQDFSFIVENAQNDITIAKDGSFETVTIEKFKILKEEAKTYFTPFKMAFDPAEEDINIVEAYVINDGVKIEVDKSNIHKSNSAARKDGLVDRSELAIPYSQIKVGSVIYFKSISKQKPGPFADYFNFKNNYGDSIPEIQDTVRIKSPKELFFTVQNPSQVLDVKTSKDKEGNFILESSMLRPHHHIAVNEIGKISSEETTSLNVTNIESWEKFGQLLNDKFTSVQLKDTIPAALKDAINKIPKDASFDKKVDASLIYITSNFDYLGDWRGHGKFVPKKMEKIVADRFGDCKDFSTLLINMLRAMNIKADYALVERTYTPSIISEKSVPMMDSFNHMIVRVENNGKIYWIDPTNRFSVGLETRADISGRKALTLMGTKSSLEMIPEIDPEKQLLSTAKLYQFESADSATVDVIYKMEGESAKISQDTLKGQNSAEFQDYFMKVLAANERYAVMNFNGQNANEKKYNNLSLKAKYKTSQLEIKDKNNGNSKIKLPSVNLFQIFNSFYSDGIGQVDIKMIPKVENAYFYKNIFLAGSSPRVCKIKTDWVNASRTIETNENGFKLKDTIEFKKTLLTKEIYANRSFESIVDKLGRCFIDSYAEYNYNTKIHSDNISTFENGIKKLSKIEKLEKRIEKAHDVMDQQGTAVKPGDFSFEDARLILENNLKENPNHSETLNVMSSYYSNSAFIVGNVFIESELKHSIEYINKAIEADPKNISALLTKSRILHNQKEFALSKELVINNFAHTDHSNAPYLTLKKIMSAFFRMKDQENALKYFDLALKKVKENDDKAELYATRANFFSNNGNNEKCIADYENSLKLNDKVAWNFGNVAICYNNLKQYDIAIDRLKKALSIMNYGAAHNVLADSYLGKGQAFCGLRKFKECEENYEMALMEFPRADVYVNMFSLYMQTGRQEKAQEANKNALVAADETYTIEWVRANLQALTAYFAKAGILNRKVASVNEDKKGEGTIKRQTKLNKDQ